MMRAPAMREPLPPAKLISMSFPKRDELSLRTVLAQPNDSMIGLVPMTRFCRPERASASAASPLPAAARAR